MTENTPHPNAELEAIRDEFRILMEEVFAWPSAFETEVQPLEPFTQDEHLNPITGGIDVDNGSSWNELSQEKKKIFRQVILELLGLDANPVAKESYIALEEMDKPDGKKLSVLVFPVTISDYDGDHNLWLQELINEAQETIFTLGPEGLFLDDFGRNAEATG